MKQEERIPGEEPVEAAPVPGAQIIGIRVLWYRSVSSTMDVAMELALAGAPEGLVVVADEQTAGRGRHSRRWLSAVGDDLLFSVVLRPRHQAAAQLPMHSGLATAQAVDRMTDGRATLKWPNDVRYGGLKIAGILIESRVEQGRTLAVAGIGLNVNSDPGQWPETANTATSLRAATGRRFDRREVLNSIVTKMDRLYARVLRGESLTAEWAVRIDTLGHEVELQIGGETVRGTAESVDEQGRLVLRTPDGKRRAFGAGEVTLQSA